MLVPSQNTQGTTHANHQAPHQQVFNCLFLVCIKNTAWSIKTQQFENNYTKLGTSINSSLGLDQVSSLPMQTM